MVSGLSSFTLEGTVDNNPDNEGYMILGNVGDEIKGKSLMQIPMEINNGQSKSMNLVLGFSDLTGKRKKFTDGSVGLTFTTKANGSFITNKATILPNNLTMKGTSEVSYEENGSPKTLKYSWTASRIK